MPKEIPENEHSELDLSEFNESSIGDNDFTFEETEDQGHEEESKSAAKTPHEEEHKKEQGTEDKKPAPPENLESAAPKFQADEINLDIVVEVGRLQMSIQKLTELEPGNVLEVDVRPENGVDLVVNGKRIAKGELLKIGEVLGVRILDI